MELSLTITNTFSERSLAVECLKESPPRALRRMTAIVCDEFPKSDFAYAKPKDAETAVARPAP